MLNINLLVSCLFLHSVRMYIGQDSFLVRICNPKMVEWDKP